MSEVQAALAPMPVGEAGVESWGVGEFLSPVAVFQPDRVDICTGFQLAIVDSSPAVGHAEAAVKHLRATADQLGREDRDRLRLLLRAVGDEVARIDRQLGH